MHRSRLYDSLISGYHLWSISNTSGRPLRKNVLSRSGHSSRTQWIEFLVTNWLNFSNLKLNGDRIHPSTFGDRFLSIPSTRSYSCMGAPLQRALLAASATRRCFIPVKILETEPILKGKTGRARAVWLFVVALSYKTLWVHTRPSARSELPCQPVCYSRCLELPLSFSFQLVCSWKNTTVAYAIFTLPVPCKSLTARIAHH